MIKNPSILLALLLPLGSFSVLAAEEPATEPHLPVIEDGVGYKLSLPSGVPDLLDDRVVGVAKNQNEFSIAVNPKDDNHLVVGANDYSTGNARVRWYTSFDGGNVWATGLVPIPGYPQYYNRAGDPSVAFTADGNVYLAGIAFNRDAQNELSGPNVVFVSRSGDGLSWTTSYIAGSPTTYPFHDKPYIAANRIRNELVLGFTKIPDPSRSWIMYTYSTSFGYPFAEPTKLGEGQFSLPALRNDGQVFVTWYEGNDVKNVVKFGRKPCLSSVCAWEFPSTGLTGELPELPVPFRYYAYPVMAVIDRGRAGPGRIYLASPGSVGGGDYDLRVQHSDNDGISWSPATSLPVPGIPLMPWMAARWDGTVAILHMDVVGACQLCRAAAVQQSLTFRNPSSGEWSTATVSDVPSAGSAATFWGDYQGLTASRSRFHTAWVDARGLLACNPQTADCVKDPDLNLATTRHYLYL